MAELTSIASPMTSSDQSGSGSWNRADPDPTQHIWSFEAGTYPRRLRDADDSSSSIELLFPGMTDPVATDDAAFQNLFARRRFFGTYSNQQMELSFIGYLWGWQFTSLLVTIAVICAWVLLSGTMLAVNRDKDGADSPWVAFAAAPPLAVLTLYLYRRIVVPSRDIATRSVEERVALLRRVEAAARIGLGLATLTFLAFSLLAEVQCRNLAASPVERNFCRYHGYVVVVSMPLLPFSFLRLPAVSIAPHTIAICFLFIVIRSVTVAYAAATPPTTIKLAIYGVSLGIYLAFISTTIVGQDRHRRDDFERTARRRRLAREVACHEARIRGILGTVLPDESLVALMKGEPVVNHSAGCTIVATRIFDYPLWSASYLPPIAVNIVDGIFSAFDRAAKKYGCDRLLQTDELYVAALGLRPLRRASNDEFNDGAFQFAVFQLRLRSRWLRSTPSRSAPSRERGSEPRPPAGAVKRHPDTGEGEPPALLAFACGIHTGSGSGSFVGNTKFVYAATGNAVNGATYFSGVADTGAILASLPAVERSRGYSVGEPRSSTRVGTSIVTFGPLFVRQPGRLQAFGSEDATTPPKGRASITAMTADSGERPHGNPTGPSNEALEMKRLRRQFLEQQGRLCMERELGSAAYFEDVSQETDPGVREGSQGARALVPQDEDEEDPAERAARLLRPQAGVLWSILLAFAPEAEEAFWIHQRAGDSTLWRQNYILYFVTCGMLVTASFAENTYTTTSLSCLFAACAIILFNWMAASRFLMPLPVEFASQVAVGILLLVGNALSLTTVLNGNLLWLHLELGFASLLMELERLRWPLVAGKVWLFGATALAVGDPRWFRLSGGLTILMSCLAFTWAAWNREVRRRATFSDEYTMEALMAKRRRQLIQLRGLLHLMIPSFVVEHVMAKFLRENCITVHFENYVMADVRIPAFDENVQALAPPSAPDPSGAGAVEELPLAALQRRVAIVEMYLGEAAGREFVGIIHVFGDTLRLGGPQRCPRADSSNLLASGIVLHPRVAAESDAVEAGASLLNLVARILKHREFTNATVGLVTDSGFGAVLGALHPTYAVVGPVARTLSSIMAAAPEGFIGMTLRYRRLLSPQAEFQVEDAEPLDIVNFGAKQTWRLRGLGYVQLHAVSFKTT